MSNVKKIDIAEFRKLGYLQEVNRLFFHPPGLALEVIKNDDGTETLGGVWDSREDPEGFIYDIANDSEADQAEFKKKRDFIASQMKQYFASRKESLGFEIENLSE